MARRYLTAWFQFIYKFLDSKSTSFILFMAHSALPRDLVQLPTLTRLGVTVPPEVTDPHQVATLWLHKFNEAIISTHVDKVIHLLLEDVLWRDILPLTWDVCSFFGTSAVRGLLQSRLAQSKFGNIRISAHKEKRTTLFSSVPNLLWIQAFFDFDSAAGPCSGVCRIVPTPCGEWKAHSICTMLEEIRGCPFALGPNRDRELDQCRWKQRREEEVAFKEMSPRVVIVGGGQSGLNAAARLKYLGVSHLVIEKHCQIGDEWRNRYSSLSLHDAVYTNHLAYLPFPPTWPVYTAAPKFGDWLEFYSKILDLNVWTSSEVSKIQRDDEKNEWIVKVTNLKDGSERILRPTYVILAMGFSVPKIPSFKGIDTFEGEVLHSTKYRQASDYRGKKVVVIGACTSGHDIAKDCCEAGLDTTMVQRSPTCVFSLKHAEKVFLEGLWGENGPPTEVADRITASFPLALSVRMNQLAMKRLKELDQPLHDALHQVGFKANWGPEDSGFILLSTSRTGGYYIDTGASQCIIDRKIKIKGESIREFTKDGLIFEDGSSLTADVVVLATGVKAFTGDQLFDEEVASELKLSRFADGEVVWMRTGLKNIYSMTGNLLMARLYSIPVALHIKAKEEGIYTSMYE